MENYLIGKSHLIKGVKKAFKFYAIFYLDKKYEYNSPIEKVLYKAEELLIKKYGSYITYGYNLTPGGDGFGRETIKEYWEEKGMFYSSEDISIPMVHRMIGPWGTINKTTEEINEIINKSESLFIEYPDKFDEKYTSLLERMADSILADNQDEDYPCIIQKFSEKLEREDWSQTKGFDLEKLLHPTNFEGYISTEKIDLTDKDHVMKLLPYSPDLDPNSEISFILYDLENLISKININEEQKITLSKIRQGYSKIDISRELGCSHVRIYRNLQIISEQVSILAKRSLAHVV